MSDIPVWDVVEEQDETLDLSPYIVDENDMDLEVTCDDGNVSVTGLSLSIRVRDWVPDRTLTIVVSDGEDSADAAIVLRVQNVNDPPGIPEITSPGDGERFEKGSAVAFEATFDDPDLEAGQVLTLIWTSDRDGELGRFTSDNTNVISNSDLSVGLHTITVTVDDGSETRSATLKITVFDDEVSTDGISTTLWAVILIVVLVVIAVFGYLLWTRKHNAL